MAWVYTHCETALCIRCNVRGQDYAADHDRGADQVRNSNSLHRGTEPAKVGKNHAPRTCPAIRVMNIARAPTWGNSQAIAKTRQAPNAPAVSNKG